MLEQLRRHSRSFIIWILFGIIIAVFIISFGPQAQQDSLGCGYSSESALEVAGEELTLTSWRFAVNGLKNSGIPAQMRSQFAADLLVERELLARAAEERGFTVSDDMVNDAIAAGEFYVLGHVMRMSDPGFWRDYRQLELLASDLGMSNVQQLADEQRREQLAEMMRQLIVRGAVSDEELRQVYINLNTKVTAEYVKFDVSRYRSALHLSEADLDRYAAAHEEELKKAWETEKAEWSSAKPRVLARHILISKTPAAKKDEAGKPGEAKKPAAEADQPVPAEQAKQVRQRLAGGADFAAVAREVSVDPSRWRGGLMGWRPADSLGYGKEVVEAAKKVAVGQLSDVIESERGFHIIKIEARSDKGLTYEQKRQDLAVKAAPTYFARALARRDADKALAEARTKPLEELFERKKAGGSTMQDLPPEVLKQLESQGIDIDAIQQGAPPAEGEQAPPEGAPPPPEGPPTEPEGSDVDRLPQPPEAPPPGVKPRPPPGKSGEGDTGAEGAEGDGKTGLIVHEGPTVLAQAGGAPPPPPKPPAGQSGQAGQPGQGQAPAKPTGKPGEQPAAGGAGGGSGEAPASEQLPEVEVEKPGLQSIGPVARTGDFLAGIGESKKLVADLFEKLEAGKLAPEVYEVGEARGPGGGDGFAIVVLKERAKADLTKFDQSRAQILADMTSGSRRIAQGEAIWGKGVLHLSEWIRQRCEETAKNGQIKVSREVFGADSEKSESEAAGYQPCATLSEPSVAGQLDSRTQRAPPPRR